MIKEQVRIKDLGSLHLRPAKEISKVASQYKCSIKLMTDNVTANAKSIISLLGACVKFGLVGYWNANMKKTESVLKKFTVY